MLVAIENRDKKMVTFLLKSGADPNALGGPGCRSPLDAAMASGNVETIDQLVSKGAEIAKLNLRCSMLRGEEHSRAGVVRHAIALGARPGIQIAAMLGDLPRVKAMTRSGIDVNSRDDEGFTALNAAGETGRLDVASYLLSAGAGANSAAPDSPLESAIAGGNERLCRLLIDRGADITTANPQGLTPLHLAIMDGLDGVARYIASKGVKVDAFAAAGLGDVARLKRLLHGDPRLVSRSLNDCTLLHWAAMGGDVRAADLLISRGARVGVKRREGVTALNLAAENNRVSMANYLISKGAVVNEAGGDGEETPLHVASRHGYQRMAALLLSKGAKIDTTGGHDECLTALQMAIRGGQEGMVRLLLSKGATLSGCDMGMTPLHTAAMAGRTRIARMLIAAGARVNAKDVSGETPLHDALSHGQTETADLLRRHGGIDAGARYNHSGWDVEWKLPDN